MSESRFLHGIARLTMVWPRGERRAEILRESGKPKVAPKAPEGQPTSIYISPKALTYPILVGVVKVAWAVLIAVLGSVAETKFIPLAICVVLGMLITVANLQEEKPSLVYWAIGLGIGLLNSLVVCGAVLGISTGRGVN